MPSSWLDWQARIERKATHFEQHLRISSLHCFKFSKHFNFSIKTKQKLFSDQNGNFKIASSAPRALSVCLPILADMSSAIWNEVKTSPELSNEDTLSRSTAGECFWQEHTPLACRSNAVLQFAVNLAIMPVCLLAILWLRVSFETLKLRVLQIRPVLSTEYYSLNIGWDSHFFWEGLATRRPVFSYWIHK